MYNGREMESLLFSSNFRYATAPEFTKTKHVMHSELNNYRVKNNGTTQLSNDSKQEDNLPGYQSVPGTVSFLDALCGDTDTDTDTVGGGGAEMDFNIARYGCGDFYSNKEAGMDSVHLVSSGAGNNMYQVKKDNNNITSANSSNLIRHSSSPAGFLSNLAHEIGFTETNDVGNFRSGRKTNAELDSTSSRLGNYIGISSGLSSHSRFMPQIAENLNECIKTSDGYLANGQHGGISNSRYSPNFANDTTCNTLKRNRDGELKMLSDLNELNTQAYQNDDSKHYTSGLVHQLSLPNTFAEMATMENFMNFQQDSTPCKIRAKRGFATHPRSIAERVRRTRISARMKKLHDLFPNMDKQANTADMLELAAVYIKDLQKEVQTLNETRAKCTCPSKRK